MKIGAVHFNPKIQPHLQHNDRTNSNADNIHKELSHLNECDKSASQALREIDTLYKGAMSKLDSAKKKGKRTPKERSFHEAIFEIDEHTSMSQCQELADRIAELTGFRKIQVVIHKDEGHTDDEGNFKPHYHAHAVFFTLDKDTGKQLARQEASLNPRTLSKIQDIASEILQMQRGQKYFKDEIYQDFLDKKAQKGVKNQRTDKIQYLPQSPSKIQNQDDFKRFKDQERKLNAENAKIQQALNNREKGLMQDKVKLEQRLKDLERSSAEAFADLDKKYNEKKSFGKNMLTFGAYNRRIESNRIEARKILESSTNQAEKENKRALEQKEREIQALTQEKNRFQELCRQQFLEIQQLKLVTESLRKELQEEKEATRFYQAEYEEARKTTKLWTNELKRPDIYADIYPKEADSEKKQQAKQELRIKEPSYKGKKGGMSR